MKESAGGWNVPMYIESSIPPGSLYGSTSPTQAPHPCIGFKVRGEGRACSILWGATPAAARLDGLCDVCI